MAVHKTNISATWDVGVAIKRLSGYPLDLSLNHASETELKTYAKENVTAYVGLLVNVVDSNGNLKDSYIIKDKAGNLKKLASASDLSGLSGVFHFKGVAESVSPDLSYVVVCETTASQEGETENYPVPIGTAADLVGDLYYGWSAENTDFWTESTTLNSQTIIYDRSEITIVAVKWQDATYYPESEALGVADLGIILVDIKNNNNKIIVSGLNYNNTDPITVYPYDESGMYSESDSLGQGEFVKYTAYLFTEKESTYSTTHEYTVITASPDNSGHVYQIGENEYASNGQIWVKLGSPVEDWIML